MFVPCLAGEAGKGRRLLYLLLLSGAKADAYGVVALGVKRILYSPSRKFAAQAPYLTIIPACLYKKI
jgi:hypothetical protein